MASLIEPEHSSFAAVSDVDRRPDGEQPYRPRRALRIGVLLSVLPVAVFTFFCLVYNAPPSPAQVRMSSLAQHVMAPYFNQDWQLFAPTPQTNNNVLILHAEVRSPATERISSVAPVNIEAGIDRLPRSNRILPTKIPGVVLAFQEEFTSYANSYSAIGRSGTKPQQQAAYAALEQQYAGAFTELDRFLSVNAESLYPRSDIVAVQAVFERQPIVPFSERYEQPVPAQPLQLVLETAWMAYTPGVAS